MYLSTYHIYSLTKMHGFVEPNEGGDLLVGGEKVDFSDEDVVSFRSVRNFAHKGFVKLGLRLGLVKDVFDGPEAGRIPRHFLLKDEVD